MKMKFFLLKFSFILLSLFILNTAYGILHTVSAQEMSSENYKLQGGQVDMTSGTTLNTGQNISLSDIVGDSNAGVFSSKGYLINPSLVFGEAASEFSLSISSDRISYEPLDSGKPSVSNLTIQAKNGNNPGYNIFLLENEPLTNHDGIQIPDTLCSKSFPCTKDQASPWDSDIFGLGYRIDGKTAASGFEGISSFKSLPSQKRGQSSSLIMSSVSRKTTDEAKLGINVRTPLNQAKGPYRNIIHIVGIPGI